LYSFVVAEKKFVKVFYALWCARDLVSKCLLFYYWEWGSA